eukprot:GFYU01010494.1.p2 GENE.GFYU01010494.1~~GFYU01010494.1.p2  ORF type:complete len:111 (+),score=5.45 GFYU01010494.1:82-414(+)
MYMVTRVAVDVTVHGHTHGWMYWGHMYSIHTFTADGADTILSKEESTGWVTSVRHLLCQSLGDLDVLHVPRHNLCLIDLWTRVFLKSLERGRVDAIAEFNAVTDLARSPP